MYYPPPYKQLNEFQTVAINSYSGGEYKGIKDPDEAHEVGDGLFWFIMCELSDEEDVEDTDMAVSRLETAVRDLEEVIEALKQET